ncbi:hypothetical protein V1478_002504 [Vespula squamosa]|uniref:Uncharacterized protein n=1 Tax=Vespula squamosa TaxID=30214 RepID=A0ABD2BTB1_VESSQ
MSCGDLHKDPVAIRRGPSCKLRYADHLQMAAVPIAAGSRETLSCCAFKAEKEIGIIQIERPETPDYHFDIPRHDKACNPQSTYNAVSYRRSRLVQKQLFPSAHAASYHRFIDAGCRIDVEGFYHRIEEKHVDVCESLKTSNVQRRSTTSMFANVKGKSGVRGEIGGKIFVKQFAVKRVARGITRPEAAIKVIYGSAFGHVGRSPKTTTGVTRQVYVSSVHHPVDVAHCLACWL